jgi:putative ABC transport system ATP-binding protein
MSALQNVLVPASFEYFRVPTNLKQRAHDLLNRVGLTQMHEPVEKLSRGEMQRVAVARALLFAPPILLADEPTASLDADTAVLVNDLLLSVCRETRSTFIVSTHDPALAMHADVLYKLVRGNLIRYEFGEGMLRRGI